MPYIVDANNLAGKLGLLQKSNFDQKLIKIISDFNAGRTRHYVLVFDARDSMGEKFNLGNIKIIYTPRDSYYQNADDKILEIATEEAGSGFTVVTDDNELKDRIKKLNEFRKNKIKQIQASDLAIRIKQYLNNMNHPDIIDKEIMTDDEKDDINDELLKIWK